MTLIYQFHFYLFGLFSVAAALIFVTRKSPVAAALWLVQTMIALAAMYIMMDAHFVGAVQVLIYAGAIMVVFLFVVMLLNLGHAADLSDLRDMRWRIGAGVVGLLLLAELLVLTRDQLPRVVPDVVQMTNVVAPLSDVFFRDYLLAFEVASVVLLAAIVGAVVLAQRTTRS